MISSQVITITLDGLAVSGHTGMTILQLAKESGVHIPTLCSDPNLMPIGACRICIVEDERNGNLMASCVTPIASGMIINTKSPAVIAHRKNIVSLLLASHPDTCMVCDKGNLCQLRQIAADLGIGLTGLYRIPQKAEIIDLNPFIERDLSKCILCGKCIRADQELVVEGAIDYFERGFMAKPATFGDSPLELSECTFCGTCVAVCPTGALSEKKKIYRGTPGTLMETICPYCGCGCTLSVEAKDNMIVRVRPGKGESVNHGAACVLGSYGLDFVNSTERLKRPLVKVDDNLVETDWANALSNVARELKRIKDKNGGKSLAVLGSSKCTNEDNYILQRFARCVLGTNNMDNGSSYYYSSVRDEVDAELEKAMCSAEGIDESDFIMVLGTDLESFAPITAYAVKRAVKFHNSILSVVDNAQTTVSRLAKIWLMSEPGSEAELINGIMKVVIEEELYDRDYITSATEDFEKLKDALGKHEMQDIEKTTGISHEQIIKQARLFSSAGKPLVVYSNKLNATVKQALVNMLILCGSSSKKISVLPVDYENNALGARDMGVLPGLLPGYLNSANAESRRSFEECWQVKLPDSEGEGLTGIIKGLQEGKIKGLYIMGENPVGAMPASSGIGEAIAAAEFVVVQDIFLSDTAKLADAVLPASSFAEKEGTFTNTWGRVQKLRKVISTVGESIPDREIIIRLAAEMGVVFPYKSIEDIQSEIGMLVRIYSKFAEEAVPDYFETVENRNKYAAKYHQEKYRFTVPSQPAAHKTEVEKGSQFTLVTGKKLVDFGSGTRVSRTSRIPKDTL